MDVLLWFGGLYLGLAAGIVLGFVIALVTYRLERGADDKRRP